MKNEHLRLRMAATPRGSERKRALAPSFGGRGRYVGADAAACRFARTRANGSFQGQVEESESGIPRTETQTATSRNFVRTDPGPVVPCVGEADSSNRPCRRRESQNRGALARRVAADVRSANRLPFLDSVLPARAMEIFVEDQHPARSRLREVTTKRTPHGSRSAFATARRARLHDPRVR